VAAAVVWFVTYGIAVGLLTFLSLVVATLLEHYFLLRERQTYLVWVGALSLCPAVAFITGWVVAGMVLPEGLHQAVRYGHVSAGVLFAIGAVVVAVRYLKREDLRSGIATLLGSLVTDAACCIALVKFFSGLAEFMGALRA